MIALLMFAVASAGAAPVEALFGETPPIQLVVRLPGGRDLREDERAAISREVELVRRRYLAMGLLVRVEDEVERLGRERPGTSVVFEPMEGGALRALGDFLGDDAAELKRRFPFPAADPATLAPRDRPAARSPESGRPPPGCSRRRPATSTSSFRIRVIFTSTRCAAIIRTPRRVGEGAITSIASRTTSVRPSTRCGAAPRGRLSSSRCSSAA